MQNYSNLIIFPHIQFIFCFSSHIGSHGEVLSTDWVRCAVVLHNKSATDNSTNSSNGMSNSTAEDDFLWCGYKSGLIKVFDLSKLLVTFPLNPSGSI